MSADILVIGAINIDLTIVPEMDLVLHDSNRADTSFAIGGVGANVARNLAFLGHRVRMITVDGTTSFHDLARADLNEHKVDTSLFLQDEQRPVNVYVNVLERNRDLHLGLNDMKAMDAFTPSLLALRKDALIRTPVLVLDNNVPEATLRYAVSHTKAAIVALDLVSAAKATNALTVLPHLTLLKANRIEFDTMQEAGFDPVDHPGLTVVVTDGDRDVTIHRGHQTILVTPPTVTDVVNVSGAGDALFSGVIDALTRGKPMAGAVMHGILLAQRVLRRTDSILKEDQR